ncbi:hypothetical protein BDN70DRAFT_875751 [Pholiota conissans]|uniref:CCD97-like C-terminal domain-containing protein n=1 Tax=Pholiota conissans TaxID=109636 RepID=A0A9P5Z6N6_9AGAR|nr:hypothetical protein BDN70DRAFT_875751 [Pholiota conissans]
MSFQFDKGPSLRYLGLPKDYAPSPETNPIPFLLLYLPQLPPNLLLHFSYITTPKQRTVIIPIRNRRLQYVSKYPPELRFENARNMWPSMWQGRTERGGIQEGKDEKAWANIGFLEGRKQHVGKLGTLLAEYEEEREAERLRELRRNRQPPNEFVPEEDTYSEDEDAPNSDSTLETEAELRAAFERLIRERFIYGLLDNIDYDKVDWDESLDIEERDEEERWFDEEE